jgi:hypothetical protein
VGLDRSIGITDEAPLADREICRMSLIVQKRK